MKKEIIKIAIPLLLITTMGNISLKNKFNEPIENIQIVNIGIGIIKEKSLKRDIIL